FFVAVGHECGVPLVVEAPVQAEQRVVFDRGVVEARGGARPAGGADDEDASFEGDALGGARVGLAAHRVVDDVGTAPVGGFLDHGHEVVDIPVDDDVGAQFAGVFGFGRAPDDTDHASARCFGQLDCGAADPAGRGMDEDGL